MADEKDGAELTRYGHDIQWVGGNYESEMLPDEEGEYVLYDAHSKLLAERDAEIERLKAENDHFYSSTRSLQSSLEDSEPEAWKSLSDEQLKEAVEYGGDSCRCFICQWTRFELERRKQLAAQTATVERLRTALEEARTMLVIGSEVDEDAICIRDIDAALVAAGKGE